MSRPASHRSLAAVGVGALLLAPASSQADAQTFELTPVVVVGDAAPIQDVTYSSIFGAPVLNDLGEIAFYGALSGPGFSFANGKGIFADNGQRIVAKHDDTVSGLGTSAVLSFSNRIDTDDVLSSLNLNNRGQVAFITGDDDYSPQFTDVPDHLVFSEGVGGPRIVAYEDHASPVAGVASPLGNIVRESLRLNDVGETAFVADRQPGGGRTIFAESSDRGIAGAAVHVVAAEGQQAPGTPRGVVFSDLSGPTNASRLPQFNNRGRVAFVGLLEGPGVVSTGSPLGVNTSAAFAERPDGTLDLVARRGSPAPVGEAGAIFSAIAGTAGRFEFNIAGQVAFTTSYITSGAVSGGNVVFLEDGQGELGVFARTGDVPAGLDDGLALTTISSIDLSDSGFIALESRVADIRISPIVSREGVFVGNSTETLNTVALAGTQAPDIDEAVEFFTFTDVQVNEAGQVAFRAFLIGEGVQNNQNDEALFATDLDGTLRLVARLGDFYDVDGDPTTAGVELLSLDFHTETGLNNAGQVAFTGRLSSATARQAIFIADTVLGLLGDYNNSGLVEQGDLDQVLGNWGQGFAAIPDTWINQRPTDGIVDQAELDTVLQNWGGTAAPDFAGNAVPEPATAVFLIGLLAMHRRRYGGR